MPKAKRRDADDEPHAGGDSHWQSIIARSLAYLCLHTAKLTEEELAAQAQFVMNLGFTRKEAARLLNTTDESLRVMMGRKKNARRSAKGRTKKRTKKR